MAEKQLDKKVLQKEIRDLNTALKKSEDNAIKKKDKIIALQEELEELNKGIESIKEQISEKETLIKKAEYSTVLDKLETAALDTLTKRQAEQLVNMIMSGDITAVLDDTHSKNEHTVDTSINNMVNKKEGV